MNTDSLRVDLADMDDVRAQLPRAREILERKRIALERCQADHDSFRELVELLAKRAGVELNDASALSKNDPGETPPPGRPDVLSLAVAVVNRENRPIRARDVQALLREEGHALVGDAVRDALYYAAKRREPPLILSLSERGYYAPLSYAREDAAEVPFSDTSDREAVTAQPDDRSHANELGIVRFAYSGGEES